MFMLNRSFIALKIYFQMDGDYYCYKCSSIICVLLVWLNGWSIRFMFELLLNE